MRATKPLESPGLSTGSVRPFAPSNMVYRMVDVFGEKMAFAIEPWTQSWGIVSLLAKRLIEMCDGRTRLSAIAESLSSAGSDIGHTDVLRLYRDVCRHGLVFNSAEEYRRSGGPVYRSVDTLLGLHIEITSACNLRCTHCYVGAGGDTQGELSTEEIIGVIDQLPSFSGKRIAISGGEPCLHRDCGRILEHCAVTCGHHVDLCTNAVQFPDELLVEVLSISKRAETTVRIQVGLEGTSAKTNDAIRGPGSFDAALKSLAHFRDAEFSGSVVLLVCVTKRNIEELEDIIGLAEKYDVAMLVFSQWQRQGRASDTSWEEVGPTAEQWIQAGEKIIGYRHSRLRVFGNFFGDLSNNAHGRYSLDSALFPKHVYWFNSLPRVTSSGDIFADQLFVDGNWKLGNVRNHTLDEVFRLPKFYGQLEAMRSRLNHVRECQTCPWQDLCECGSPGHTYSEYGDINRKDVFCESRAYWFERFVRHQVEQAEKATLSEIL
ncbi:MAG: radical SAM protein [Phycisphaerales bacterium]|nr:MAG: radical SAM protein [Phycisphaerales bacterium]